MEGELGNSSEKPVFSGSKAEGLRFKSSDDDWMFIDKDVKVIPSDSYKTIYDSNITLLLMVNEMTKPGFTLLRLVGESAKPKVSRSTVSNPSLNGQYISCKLWRESGKQSGVNKCHEDFIHGPCASGICGPVEYDAAYCLQSDIWPNNAQDCIMRLNKCGWPSRDTVLSIVKDGVLFVPIGAKQSIFEDVEWRMSFSLAEKKLIHAMNHTQFLCYGLLKIFLKEAIDVNPNVKGLLCSYFLKTALFWEITTTSRQWNQWTLLSCFWNCFRRLLKWISFSYCPNFFIPQNNMFEGKIEGTNRDKLLQHLSTLFYEGYKCLLRCQSLIQCDLSFGMNTPGMYIIEKSTCNSIIAAEILTECYQQVRHSICTSDISAGKKCTSVNQLAKTTNNSLERFILKHRLHQTSTEMCMAQSSYSTVQFRCNRPHYRNLTQRLHVLQRFAVDSVSHILYQAMLCYNAGKYNQTLRLVQLSKVKISDPNSLHAIELDMEKYQELGGDNLPIETMLRKHFIENIEIFNDEIFPDLYIERNARGRFKTIMIPPLVLAFFLQYLCQRQLWCQIEANEAIYDLSLFLHHENGRSKKWAVSWQILGICQQTNGDDQGACRSYLTALQQDFKYRHAACFRLGTILVKYISSNI